MLTFDNDKSHELDEEIVQALNNLLEDQKSIGWKSGKQEFLLKERKTIYELLMKVNEERKVKL